MSFVGDIYYTEIVGHHGETRSRLIELVDEMMIVLFTQTNCLVRGKDY